MASPDPRIDAYIARQAEFARPILTELRHRVHAACPAVDETIKWGAPAFTYKGKLLAVMAAFQKHAAFNLWHGKHIVGADAATTGGMGQYGRIASTADLPGKGETAAHIRAAMGLVDSGARAAGDRTPKPAPHVPADLATAMAGNPAARATWEAFTPGKQRDYAEWITSAKREVTRARRVAQSVEWLADGKARNWKHGAR
jgi:uncharacterized protein YdeI (YjbR/CyaY-like superfamily)